MPSTEVVTTLLEDFRVGEHPSHRYPKSMSNGSHLPSTSCCSHCKGRTVTAIIEKTTTNNGDPGLVPGTERVCKHMGTEDLHTGTRQTAHLTVTVFCLDYTHF